LGYGPAYELRVQTRGFGPLQLPVFVAFLFDASYSMMMSVGSTVLQDGHAIVRDAIVVDALENLEESFDRLIMDGALKPGETKTEDWHVMRHVRQSDRLDWEVLDLSPVSHVLDLAVSRLGDALGEVLKSSHARHDDLILNTCGIVTSFPQCGPQVIHRDGPAAPDPYAITAVSEKLNHKADLILRLNLF